jgi:hypothetical protein
MQLEIVVSAKVKRFERFEGWALWAFFIYLGVHLIFT